MATINDLPASIQDRIHIDAALMILSEEERKAYILRCCALRRQPFIQGLLDPADFYERPVSEGEREAYQAGGRYIIRSSPRKRAIMRSTASSKSWRQGSKSHTPLTQAYAFM